MAHACIPSARRARSGSVERQASQAADGCFTVCLFCRCSWSGLKMYDFLSVCCSLSCRSFVASALGTFDTKQLLLACLSGPTEGLPHNCRSRPPSIAISGLFISLGLCSTLASGGGTARSWWGRVSRTGSQVRCGDSGATIIGSKALALAFIP